MNILQDYDYDQLYPVYGFGGKVKDSPDQSVSHCFALNGDIYKPECNGTAGVLEAYYNSMKHVDFFGPTHFNEVIRNVNGHADYSEMEISQQNQRYTVLLILTDGIINDMADTIE